ncbi:MAG: hypothetical protein SOW78_02855 [Clostridia bacterium]|nr:hypothetical protein [Oscillospiraceae bacterium]MDY3303207.1 hypothetical protein [Clostridia bacterium]MDY5626234.1 hypothetical protein [Clostridia bacterium]
MKLKKRSTQKKFFSQYFRDSNKNLTITRNPLSIDDAQARKKFLRLISDFENNNKLNLSNMSKSELLFLFLDFAETTNSIIHLKDDARQFMAYRLLFPDIMKLYLYKMFYPRIFDFDIIEKEKGKEIKFKSSYIEENFKQIYRQIEFMCLTIVYDALLIATENCSMRHIEAMKSYKANLIPSDSVDNILANLDLEFKAEKETRTELVEKFKTSIIFFARYYNHLYKGRKIENKLLTSILKLTAFYSGKRADNSRNALIDAYRECHQLLNDTSHPFIMLLNMYHINKNSCLYDLDILKDNVDFMPYAIDGIITKQHISKMILDNNTGLQKETDTSLNLSSVYNNPNCIISNLTPKDYEILDFTITHSAKSFETYYFKKDDIDLKTSIVCKIIDWIDRGGYTATIAETIPVFENLETNNVDYAKVVSWIKPTI